MAQTGSRPTGKATPLARWRRVCPVGRLEAAFLALTLVALALRLWELEGRTMHYDEAIHLHTAWKLAQGKEYIHAPWMHGPFQVEFSALIMLILGDSDFTARLLYVLFGSALAALPYFLREHIGRAGALVTGVMLTLSPTLLYFSRFGRNDILMAFWATSLLVLMWRYLHQGKSGYLYLASAVLAFMFATKETAYIVALVFGILLFMLALPDLVPWALGRIRLAQLAGPAGFLLLLITLTLPQWAAMAGLFQDALGLTLVNREGVALGIVGAPHWAPPFVPLPVFQPPAWLHVAAAAALVAGLGLIEWPVSGRSFPALARGVGPALAAVAGTAMALLRPLGDASGGTWGQAADFFIAGGLAMAAVAALVMVRYPWQRAAALVLVPVLLALLYLAAFTNLVEVDSVVHRLLPTGISVEVRANAVPVNYLVAGGLLAGALLATIAVGVRWLGGRWLVCASVFYGIWATLYTTVFDNLAGMFSGSWLSMGYWVAQQDVARGNQPWYYYLVGLSVYELLPVAFGALGAVYFLRRGDVFGIALAGWAGLTLLAYTAASEKMPWLLVNVTLPFIVLSGKYLGELMEGVAWQQALRRGLVMLLVLPPLVAVAAVYLLYGYVKFEGGLLNTQWALLAATALLALLTAYLVRLAPARSGVALAGLGLAGLLLAFGASAAYRAVYTYDDSNKEILVYAQGSSDLAKTFQKLEDDALLGRVEGGTDLLVDYDMWFPFQWYVRRQGEKGSVRFSCFKDSSEHGWNAGCKPVSEDQSPPALLLTIGHGGRNATHLLRYQREGPLRDLLWFPESYRRPHENRPAEGFVWGFRGLPSKTQVGKDFQYFKEVATSRGSWADALAYLIFRDLKADWYKSEFYSYSR